MTWISPTNALLISNLPNSSFPHIKTEDINKGGDFKLGSMHPHTHKHSPSLCQPLTHETYTQTSTLLMWSWVQIFPQTHPISWGSAHERGCGVPVDSYKHTLQTVMKRVHPNWECLTRKCLNQLVNKRVHPFPPLTTWTILYHHNQHLSSTPPCKISWKKSIYVV